MYKLHFDNFLINEHDDDVHKHYTVTKQQRRYHRLMNNSSQQLDAVNQNFKYSQPATRFPSQQQT